MLKGQKVLDEYRGALEQAMRSVLEGRTSALYDMMRYALGWTDQHGNPSEGSGGKRLRPAFCLASCEALGEDYQRALPAAVALELLHNFSLIHDDVQDASGERHHSPAVWRLWGAAQAINAGDGMYALSRLALLGLAQQGIPLPRVHQALESLDKACLLLCEGQFSDLVLESKPETTLDDYLDMIRGKTGALMGCSLELGALVASEDGALRDAFRQAGEKLGMAFQIKDDYLDLWGNGRTGKTASADLWKKKKSLPIIYVVAHGSASAKQAVLDIYAKPLIQAVDVLRVLGILEQEGAKGAALKMAASYYQEALRMLDNTGLATEGMEKLKSLAAFVVERDF